MANVGESSNPGAQVPIPVSTAQVPTPAVTVPVNHAEKPEKFNGLNFKRWQQKMPVLSDHTEPCEVFN